MIFRYIQIFFAVSFLLMTTSCKKYLEAKSVQNLSTPGTYNDLEAILNNSSINQGTQLLNGLGDEYYFKYNDYISRPDLWKKAYLWDAALNDYSDWSQQYNAAFNANTVLYNLEIVGAGDVNRYNNIKGEALFYRALALYRAAQLFAPKYDSTTASSDLGVPLRTTADVNIVSTRSTVEGTYQQLVNDIIKTLDLLPTNVPSDAINKTRPTKVAAYSFLARLYLQMGEYAKARDAASNALLLYSTLMNFYDLSWVNPGISPSVTQLNPETILYSVSQSSPTASSVARIDSSLYQSYDVNDLRKTVYFKQNSDGTTYIFKGSYAGSTSNLFSGFATDELYLIRAECAARAGAVNEAMKDLNDLLRTRWKKNTYSDLTAVNAADALTKILIERKKELVYREIRWSDIKRLNKESAQAITLVRNLNGQLVSLLPNDFRYALLIPKEVIAINAMPQNPR